MRPTQPTHFTRPAHLRAPDHAGVRPNPRLASQDFLFWRWDFQIRSDGTVLITPSDSTDKATYAHRVVTKVLLREDPETREFILNAIENNQTGMDIPALRKELQLDARQMDVLRENFGNCRLRRLSAEQPPRSSIQDVVQALQQEVQRLRKYLSMRDVLMLARFAAKEIARRSPDTQVLPQHETLGLYKSLAADRFFEGRTLDEDGFLNREMGTVEMQVDDQLMKANDGLAPLLKAPARWLDTMLHEAIRRVPPLHQQQREVLARSIRVAYVALLSQCFSLDEDGPQRIHHLLQHLVRGARDLLEEGVDSSKKRKADAPPPKELSVEQSRQQARADELHVSVAARAMLTGDFELQEGLRCLQHAYNNGWSNWTALNRPTMPFVKLSLPNEAQELGRIDAVLAPDGHHMQRLRLMPRQLRALMPELEAHLDLAIVFKGPTNLRFGDSQVHQTHHYTALIKVNGVHFELESQGADAQAGKCWLPSLRLYLEGLEGGAYMAIRGADEHPLSKYVKLMGIEPFWKTCEALGVFLGNQPIVELAKYLPVDRMQDAARHIDANLAADFCRTGLSYPHAKSHETNVPEGNGRSKAIVNWLNTLGTNRAILWTGTDPMVMAVQRAVSGDWFAHERGSTWQRSLPEVLDGQQLLFEGLPPEVRTDRAGFARALTLMPPDVNTFSPVLAQGAVQEPLPVPSVAVPALPRPDEGEIARSEMVLLTAIKMYPRYPINAWTYPLLAIQTGREIIDFVLRVELDNASKFNSLITISFALSPQHPSASQHVAVLYLLRGPYSGRLLELLPSEIPPCLVPHTERILANVSAWRNIEQSRRVLAKLGIEKPIIDLT